MSLFYLMLMLTLTSLTAIITGASLTSSPALSSSFMASDIEIEEKTIEESSATDRTVELLDANRPSAVSYCNDEKSAQIRHSRRLLYVSTLDGRLSALDITAGGKVHWSVATGPGPLLSSNIHRLELTNNGRFVRMIPSLSGGIYKFDGELIEPIPITGENLLSSSAKFSDDLVISGGKEIRTYGVSARTGEVIYECSIDGCTNNTEVKQVMEMDPLKDSSHLYSSRHSADIENYRDYVEDKHDPLLDDVIIIRRHTQTVRAVETRTGVERWNFSVGQHELDVVQSSDCHEYELDDLDLAILNLSIKVIVPEGVICVFNKAHPQVLLWKHKFDHPIVGAWKMGLDNQLHSIDMFASVQWHWSTNGDNNNDPNIEHENQHSNVPLETFVNPSIYLGMYQKQLYIQESIELRSKIMDRSNLHLNFLTNSLDTRLDMALPKIPWRPVAVKSNTLALIAPDDFQTEGEKYIRRKNHELVPYGSNNSPAVFNNNAISSQSVLNASEYVNGNGFYLFAKNDIDALSEDEICNKNQQQETQTQEEQKLLPLKNTGTVDNHTPSDNKNKELLPARNFELAIDNIEAPVKVVILSLWFWWKEIAVIAFTSAILLNLLIGSRSRSEREIVVIERHIPVPTAIEATETNIVALQKNSTILSTANSNILTIPRTSLTFSQAAHNTSVLPINASALSNQQNTTLSGCQTAQGTSDSSNMSQSTGQPSEKFCSRFQSDFDMMRCLGRGGFGVVFEAKNKLDDCRYAIKRITLPNKEESRARVMREVKTLANCEHQNIVRYFQSWVEKPPHGWQEEEDRKWLANEASTSLQIYTPTSELDSQVVTPINDVNPFDFIQNSFNKARTLKNQSAKVKHKKKSCKQNKRDVSSLDIDLGYTNSDAKLGTQNEELESDGSSIIFQLESQANDLMSKDPEDGEKNTENITHKKETVSIDIQSSGSVDSISPEVSERWARQIDCSEISDSFQIEFIGPSNDEVEENEARAQLDGVNKKERTRSPPHLLLDMNALETKRSPEKLSAVPLSSPRGVQNKVYLYIQMQLCRKESLKDWLKDNRIEDRSEYISSIFHQIVDAVDYVHYKGLIHRDLKPSNIFFSQDGQVKIGDFGLVTDMADIPNTDNTKDLDQNGLPYCVRHTQQVGTHLYMSPEQVQGLPYDYKVDIYSLGLIFFELLVFFGTEMERILTLRNLRDGRYPNSFAQQHAKEYSLLQKMLSPQPIERPATHELKIQLNDILKIPDMPGESESAALIAAARRLSRSRTFSSSFE